MRSSPRVDQAEGLRRLLVRDHTQVITVVAGKSGVGRTSTIINLAAAMVLSGKEVLVLDENHSPNNFRKYLGSHSRYDLLDVAQGKCKSHEAVLDVQGFYVLSAARIMHSQAPLKLSEQQRLENALTEVSRCKDVILVDAAMPVLSQVENLTGKASTLSSLASGISMLVVVEATTSGITDSYTLIKRLALKNARLQFEIVVNKVTDEQAAKRVFNNMAKVARSNLAARLEYLGHIPYDDRLNRSTQLGRSVVEAFPTATSAQSCLDLAQQLLHLPMPQNESGGGASIIIQNLMSQVSQPLRQHSKKVAHVVN